MNTTGMVVSAISYFLAISLLLGVSGIAGQTLIFPSKTAVSGNDTQQSFGAAVLECILTLYTDCSQHTTTSFFDGLTAAVNFAVQFLEFFFQLLSFTLPIPTILNAIIVLPGATGLAYVGIRIARGGG